MVPCYEQGIIKILGGKRPKIRKPTSFPVKNIFPSGKTRKRSTIPLVSSHGEDGVVFCSDASPFHRRQLYISNRIMAAAVTSASTTTRIDQIDGCLHSLANLFDKKKWEALPTVRAGQGHRLYGVRGEVQGEAHAGERPVR